MSDLPPALAHPPSWGDPTPPPPGAWCRACHGTRWWTERQEPHGWRCLRCHPPAHLPAEAIRREGEAVPTVAEEPSTEAGQQGLFDTPD
jgi:hypothetical protein